MNTPQLGKLYALMTLDKDGNQEILHMQTTQGMVAAVTGDKELADKMVSMFKDVPEVQKKVRVGLFERVAMYSLKDFK